MGNLGFGIDSIEVPLGGQHRRPPSSLGLENFSPRPLRPLILEKVQTVARFQKYKKYKSLQSVCPSVRALQRFVLRDPKPFKTDPRGLQTSDLEQLIPTSGLWISGLFTFHRRRLCYSSTRRASDLNIPKIKLRVLMFTVFLVSK